MTEENLGRVVDTYRARMTTHIAMSLAVVTLTGYALKDGARVLFLAAALLPVLMLFADFLIKATIAGPFLYKALMSDTSNPESEALLFLDFTRGEKSKFGQIRDVTDAAERRKQFRIAYLCRGLLWKVLILGSASATEIFLYYSSAAGEST